MLDAGATRSEVDGPLERPPGPCLGPAYASDTSYRDPRIGRRRPRPTAGGAHRRTRGDAPTQPLSKWTGPERASTPYINGSWRCIDNSRAWEVASPRVRHDDDEAANRKKRLSRVGIGSVLVLCVGALSPARSDAPPVCYCTARRDSGSSARCWLSQAPARRPNHRPTETLEDSRPTVWQHPAMAYRIFLADGSHLDFRDDDRFDVHPSGALTVQGHLMRTTYAPHAWVKIVEQLG